MRKKHAAMPQAVPSLAGPQPQTPPAPSSPRGAWITRLVDDRHLATKILAVAALGVVLAAGIGQLAMAELASVEDSAQRINTHGVTPTSEMAEIRRNFLQARIDSLADQINPSEGPEHEAFLTDIKNVDAALKTFVADNELGPGERELVDQFQSNWETYQQIVGGRLLDLARADEWDQYFALRDAQVKPAATAIVDALTGLGEATKADAAGEVAKAHRAYTRARTIVYATLGVGLLVVLGLSLLLARRIARQVNQTAHALRGLAEGDLVQHLEVHSHDEVGQMAQALNTATANLREAMSTLDHDAQALASASEELSSVSGQMSGSAEESASQAGVVSAAAEQVSVNVQTVATGTEEMSASIREIAQSAANAATVAARAVDAARVTTATVAKLGDSSTEIGNVIKVITSIAEQTNLLALNATIEAARAGDAGRGFAVVASEVKALAAQTAKATDEISAQIAGMQSATRESVSTIKEIGATINLISEISSSIAAAVEEQGAATQEIARNVQYAAQRSGEVAQSITEVSRGAGETGAASGQVLSSAQVLSSDSSRLKIEVEKFLTTVRAT